MLRICPREPIHSFFPATPLKSKSKPIGASHGRGCSASRNKNKIVPLVPSHTLRDRREGPRRQSRARVSLFLRSTASTALPAARVCSVLLVRIRPEDADCPPSGYRMGSFWHHAPRQKQSLEGSPIKASWGIGPAGPYAWSVVRGKTAVSTSRGLTRPWPGTRQTEQRRTHSRPEERLTQSNQSGRCKVAQPDRITRTRRTAPTLTGHHALQAVDSGA